MSCDWVDNACDGGLHHTAFNYVIGAGGLCLEINYPYTSGATSARGACNSAACVKAVTISGYTSILGELGMATFVTKTGPIIIYVDASNWDTYPSSGPKWNTASCPASGKINHAVQLVGLFIPAIATSYVAYWKLRNSW